MASVRAAADLIRIHGNVAFEKAEALLNEKNQTDIVFWEEVMAIVKSQLETSN